jgi:hypothetical protein
VSENTFTPMYSVLSVFPQTFPIFLRETKSGLYSTDQYYLSNMIAMVSDEETFTLKNVLSINWNLTRWQKSCQWTARILSITNNFCSWTEIF